ncbi:MAG: hypothetical protein R3B47_12265 [Bacteroidia bacterium]
MRYILCIPLLLLAACGSSPGAESKTGPAFELPAGPLVDDALTNTIIGTWESHSLSITMPTHGGSDSTFFLRITPENWQAEMGTRPIKTWFLANGEYYAEYYDLQGNLINRPRGYWGVDGNILMYDEQEPAQNRFFQEVLYLEKDLFQFSFTMDYDGDGEADDIAVGVSRKLE